ncbi:sugar ABC transporter substrate-binding protein [Paenibacillus flagellatus]|uniref:LacI family transcriptional regulator n=1 Tax=Paenibacillus flagellatus TaxID=2211139 RepID=A0A2V5KLG7_9BACL|nr:sugar ABC transporter substrate-binding protein [Paenibacillus flagellatus]PYI55860.1 LacI family transcriptional regulator [Paenibacillus flagellatus]
MRTRSRSYIAVVMAVILAVVLAACGAKKEEPTTSAPATGGSTTNAGGGTDLASLAGKKIALVMEFNQGTFSAQYIEGVKEQVEKFGGKVTVLSAETDMNKMIANLDSAVNQKFDGILIDHGKAEALEPGVKKALEKKIPVVAFDSDLKVPGVPVLQQGDQQMAKSTLEQMAKDIGGKGNIVKIWVAGFAPMERRQLAYKEFMDKNKDIKEIAAFGAATNNTALDTQAQMEAILKKYPNKGDITAVWAAWDEFAKGASRAIQQAGRTEIKVYGIDLSDEDLQMIQDKNSPWVASAAVDPKDIGRVQARYLYQKLLGETTPDVIALDPVFVSRDQLPTDKTVSTTQLGQYVKGWSGSQQGLSDKLKELEKQAKK